LPIIALLKIGSIRLAYCRTERAWCFSYVKDDSCDYFMKSPDTDNFDLIDVAGNGWLAKTNTGDVPVGWLAVSCNDCGNDCQGVCVDNKCECDGQRLGFNCEFEPPACKYYSLDFRTKGGLANILGARLFLDTEFASLSGYGFIPESDPILKMYDRLWYIPNPREDRGNRRVNAFMIFTGRRWVIFSVQADVTAPYTILEFHRLVRSIANNKDITEVDKLSAVAHSDAFAAYKPTFFSTPVDWGTDSYGLDPSEVQWVMPIREKNSTMLDFVADDNSPISAKLMCSECDEEIRPCFNDGLCNESGQCLCTPFYDGSLCEYTRSCLNDEDCYNGGM
jgi:hypothetical protein